MGKILIVFFFHKDYNFSLFKKKKVKAYYYYLPCNGGVLRPTLTLQLLGQMPQPKSTLSGSAKLCWSEGKRLLKKSS